MMRHWLKSPVWIFLFGAILPAAAAQSSRSVQKLSPSSVEISAYYGQGFDFWDKVQSIRKGQKDTSELLQILNSSFDHPEEGIASLLIRYHGPVDEALGGIVDRAYFGVGVDALAGGIARNRILPELQAFQVNTAHIDFGLLQRVSPQRSGWEYKLGSTLGVGEESLIQGSAINLVGQSAPGRSTLFYTGLESGLGYRNQFNESLSSRYSLSFSPTLFHTDYSGSATQFKIASDQTTLRWRQENEWTLALETPFGSNLDFGVHSILGQQPTPSPFLPRTWDSVHGLNLWPSAGQLVGLGTKIHAYGARNRFGLSLEGGFYGGYFGGEASLKLFMIKLAAGTYGLEQSSGFRTDGSRIGFVALGGQIAL